MGGRRHLGPMKATAEATTAHSGGFFASSSLPRTFVDPAKCLPDMRKTKDPRAAI